MHGERGAKRDKRDGSGFVLEPNDATKNDVKSAIMAVVRPTQPSDHTNVPMPPKIVVGGAIALNNAHGHKMSQTAYSVKSLVNPPSFPPHSGINASLNCSAHASLPSVW